MRNIDRACAKNVVLAIAFALLLGTALFAQDPPDRTSEPVYEVRNGVTAPKPVYTPDPQYTDKARRKRINGTVTLALIVTAEGKVRDVKVTESLDEGLDKQAIAAVSTWRFQPATKDGKPVAVHLRAQTAFKLY